MNKFYISRELVHYESITNEKKTVKMYYMGIDDDYDTVSWVSDKTKAKVFTEYNTVAAVAGELGGSVVIEPTTGSVLDDSLKN